MQNQKNFILQVHPLCKNKGNKYTLLFPQEPAPLHSC